MIIKTYSEFRLNEVITFQGKEYYIDSIWYLEGGLIEYEVKLWT